ncbi:hypothetical protein O3G_MSEX006932 [Manduca sexta]|uniref:Uncharacterized protein n=2 Tax=Manduca sexta TaxID=7130 RepID=A0A921Z5T2_MANSE|nr:hypothetical protein O3G_MSEX006932 [Manduca sexta]
MVFNFNTLLVIVAFKLLNTEMATHKRQRRYLLFTKDTQWGVFVTVSIPLHPDTYVSVAWFFEANYYNVDNSTYFDPLLGDIEVSRGREDRDVQNKNAFNPNDFSRQKLYTLIEGFLEKHGLPGRECLLRAICEHASVEHNGLLGDLLYLILTPSTSMSEENIEDEFYEAELYGMDNQCEEYAEYCKTNPLDAISTYIDGFV